MPLFGSNIPDKPKAIEKLKSIEIPKPIALEKPEKIRLPVDKQLPPASIEQNQAVSGKKGKSSKLSEFVSGLAGGKKSAPPKAWAVQVGSFAKRNNALALQKKLRDKKYPAFVEFVKNTKTSVYRVRIGPQAKRERAEAIQKDIKKTLGIKGVVVSHP